ncbi:poly-beta-1,6-N-acetyl-D-glucosamine biosynthesis protein PgaD [Exiguobacterium sp.]|uniref:poly-beta-1,6-N-acetyl-D-glucosamine biosynthesis protein PgaD n=1 Tax=Exiguobacterium sp. TaxID=44751 RepID=UPI00391CA30C
MEFTRPRDATEQSLTEGVLVKTKHSIFRKIFDLVLTIIFWGYTLVVTWFFLSALIGVNDRYIATVKTALNVTNADIRGLLALGLMALLASALILFTWRTYNKKRYGSLNRRKPPTPTTIEELASLGLMDEADIQRLQTEKVVVFTDNPVKELPK